MINKRKHWETSAVYAVDFADRLEDGETLSSGATLVVSGALDGGATGDLTIADVSISGTKVRGTISGGKCREQYNVGGEWLCRYLLKAKVVTSNGERESEEVQLTVHSAVERTAVA